MSDTNKNTNLLKEGYALNRTALFFYEGDYLSIELPYEGIKVKLSKHNELSVFLKEFKNSKKTYCTIDYKLVHPLILHRIVVPKRFNEVISLGTTSEARSYQNIRTTLIENLHPEPTIIGSSVDFAQVGDKTSFIGPQEIRKELSVSIQDIGNVAWFSSDNIFSYGKRVAYCIFLCISNGCLPIVLGGDHSITKFAFEEISAHQQTPVGFIHLDAHNDLGNLEDINNTALLLHSNVIAHVANTNCSYIAQFGLREDEIIEKKELNGIPLFQFSSKQAEKSEKFLDELKNNLFPDTPIYLSVDLDCLDPGIAPEVTTPLSAGLFKDDFFFLLKKVLSSFKVIGIDFVEVSSSNKKENKAAWFAAEVIKLIYEEYKDFH